MLVGMGLVSLLENLCEQPRDLLGAIRRLPELSRRSGSASAFHLPRLRVATLNCSHQPLALKSPAHGAIGRPAA